MDNNDKTIHPKRLTKADIQKLKESLPKRLDIKAESKTEEGGGITPVLETYAPEVAVPLSGEMISAFNLYAHMLREKNKVMNLTAIVDDNGIAMRHFVDSLTLGSFISEEQVQQGHKDLTLIDVGTGAGFPGIPLKISMPVLKVTLMDSLAKRVNFLKEVCEALGLEDMEFIHSRAEDGGRDKKLRQKYDIATARAVAALPVLCEYCLPFVKKGGIFLAMKGRSEEEVGASGKAISTLGGVIEKVESFTLPGTDMERSVIVIRKVKDTPAAYPRQAGKPSKDPIL